MQVYPLKFHPIYKETIWGGSKISSILKKRNAPAIACGESWEISGITNNISIVSNGLLAGKSLTEIIDLFQEKLLGNKVFEQFGNHFPLLIKYIDASEPLSVQVHPNDGLAKARHQSNGKTEMWYVIDSEPDSSLISGFSKQINKEKYVELINLEDKSEFLNILGNEKVQPNDVFFLPAGRIHAIGKGILLAEIQQTSDITYRVYDWDRLGLDGKSRELHTNLALDAITFEMADSFKTKYISSLNNSCFVCSCENFHVNVLEFDTPFPADYSEIDSFVILMGIDGNSTIKLDDHSEFELSKGETLLIPAALKKMMFIPEKISKILEIFV